MTSTLGSRGPPTPAPEIKAQLLREEALEALAKAHPIPVQFCRRTEVDYRPEFTDSPPHINYTASFKKGDYIHFKLQYSDDWWIGRVVGDRRGLFFIPSEEKLKAVTKEIQMTEKTSPETDVYSRAPITRPIVLMGPSGKKSRLTDLLQKPLISFMKERFAGRLVTLKPDFSVTCNMTVEQARRLHSEVYAAGASMNLVFLDCNASCPEDLAPAKIHPHVIYVNIARQKVLHKLVQQMTANSRERDEQLQQAYHLYENSHNYSLIISDSNVDDACLTLELFLESYWAFTRSVILVDTLNLTSGVSIATSASARPKLAAQTTIDATVTT